MANVTLVLKKDKDKKIVKTKEEAERILELGKKRKKLDLWELENKGK